jgi:hypothetical protein
MNQIGSLESSVDTPDVKNPESKVERPPSRRNIYIIAIIAFVAIAGLMLYSNHTSHKLYVDDITIAVDGRVINSESFKSNSTNGMNATLSENYAQITADQYHTPPYSVGLDDNGAGDAGTLYYNPTQIVDFNVYNATWYMRENQEGLYSFDAMWAKGNTRFDINLQFISGSASSSGNLLLNFRYSNSSSPEIVQYDHVGYKVPTSEWVRFSLVVDKTTSSVIIYADGVILYGGAIKPDYVRWLPEVLMWIG